MTALTIAAPSGLGTMAVLIWGVWELLHSTASP